MKVGDNAVAPPHADTHLQPSPRLTGEGGSKVAARGNLGPLNTQAGADAVGLDAALTVNGGRSEGGFGMAAPAQVIRELQANQALYDKIMALDESQLTVNMRRFVELFETAQGVVAYLMDNAELIRNTVGVDVESITPDSGDFSAIFALMREAQSGLLGAADTLASMEAESMERQLEKNEEIVKKELESADKEFTKTTTEATVSVSGSTLAAGMSLGSAGSAVKASSNARLHADGARRLEGIAPENRTAVQIATVEGYERTSNLSSAMSSSLESGSRTSTELGRSSGSLSAAEMEREANESRARAKEEDLAAQVFGAQRSSDDQTGKTVMRTATELSSQLNSAMKESAEATKAAAQVH